MSNKQPRNLLVGLAILMFIGAIGINWLFSPGQEVQVVTVSLICPPRPQKVPPTPTPTLIPIDGDLPFLDNEITMSDYIFLEPSEYECSPILGDFLSISWCYTMTITDALSQTIIIQGPATVRFGEGEGE